MRYGYGMVMAWLFTQLVINGPADPVDRICCQRCQYKYTGDHDKSQGNIIAHGIGSLEFCVDIGIEQVGKQVDFQHDARHKGGCLFQADPLCPAFIEGYEYQAGDDHDGNIAVSRAVALMKTARFCSGQDIDKRCHKADSRDSQKAETPPDFGTAGFNITADKIIGYIVK